MKRCKDCVIYDPDAYWCDLGSLRDPDTPVCEYFVEKDEEG